MYKNLSPESLGLSGRQSELIELALTYGFKGFDVRIAEMVKRAELHGTKHTLRFIESAKIKVGGFPLTVRWQGTETEYKADLANVSKVGELAAAARATRCFTNVMPASDEHPYHENFELHRERLGAIVEALGKFNIKLAIGFLAPPSYREGREYQFIQQAEQLLLLIKSVGSPHAGLLLDTWHWRVGGGGMDQIGELSGDQIVIVRMAEVPEDADLSKIEEKQRLLPSADESSDAVALLKMLDEKDYNGPVSLYPHSRRFSGMTRDAIVQKTAESFENLMKAAGLTKPVKVPVVAAEQ